MSEQGQDPATPEPQNGPDDSSQNGDSQPTDGNQFVLEHEGERWFAEPYVAQLRTQSAGYRKQLRQVEQQFETASGELERLTELLQKVTGVDDAEAFEEALQGLADLRQQNQDFQQQLLDSAIQAAVIASAARAGIADPEDAYRLADLSDVKVADDGAVSGVDDAVKALVQDKPYLLRQDKPPTPDPGATAPGQSDRLTREDVKGMTSEQINANWEAVQAAMQDET